MTRVIVITANRLDEFVISQAISVELPDAAVEIHNRAHGAMSALLARRADMAIVDPQMPDQDGLDYIPQILTGKLAARLVIVSRRSDERTLAVLSQLKCSTWVDARSAGIDELRRAIRNLNNSCSLGDPSLMAALRSMPRPTTCQLLSPLQELMLSVFGAGLDNSEAGLLLGMLEDTARTHRARIMKKLGLHHRGELIGYAHSRGYVRVTPERILHPGFEEALRLVASGDRKIRALQAGTMPALNLKGRKFASKGNWFPSPGKNSSSADVPVSVPA